MRTRKLVPLFLILTLLVIGLVPAAAQDALPEAEIVNDEGRLEAMAYPTNALKRGHTFFIFGQPPGAAGELVSDNVDPTTTIPYYKGAWADIRRIGRRPELSRTVSFLPQNVAE